MVKKMRLPTSAEWDTLITVSGGSNSVIHWKDMFSWCQDISSKWPWTRVIRGFFAAGILDTDNAWTQDGLVGFRPAFEFSGNDSLPPDGATIVAGTLFMDGVPVKVPENPTRKGDIPSYIPGTKLEMRPALDDPAYQVRAIKAGGVLIADRVLLRNISWDECQESKMRLPTFAEWDALIAAVNGRDDMMHWENMYSWCHDTDPAWALRRMIRGYSWARKLDYYRATPRYVDIGFRPVIEVADADSIGPDGTIVTAGALCMDGVPVKVPQNPVWNGDIPDYIPGARLTLRPDAGYFNYQVWAIKVGNILIADRCLLKRISWEDCQMATEGKFIAFMH